MISFQQAREIARLEIQDSWTIQDDSPVLLDQDTIEKPYAWIFFYNSKQWVENGNIMYALGGNAPLFISKVTGQIKTFATGNSIEGMIELYEEENGYWELTLLNDIYTNPGQLFTLKKVMGLTMERVAALKLEKLRIIEKGGKNRLKQLQTLLKEKGIASNILPGKISDVILNE